MKTDALSTLVRVPATVLALCLPLPGLAAQDLAKRQLAAGAAESRNTEQRADLVERTRDYDDRRDRAQQQIRTANASAALLGGTLVGIAGSLTPAGPVGGGVIGALARIQIEDWLNSSLLDKSTRLTLTHARAQNRVLYDAFITSTPGSDQRSSLTQDVMDRSPYMELLHDLEDGDARAGPLLEHAASLEEYLLGLDPEPHASIGTMTASEAADWVASEVPDLQRAIVDHAKVIHDGRNRALRLARDWKDIVERIGAQGTPDSSANPEVASGLGNVVVQRGDDFLIPDRVFTEDGDIIDISGDMFGQQTGEHDEPLAEIEGELIDLNASYRRLLSAQDFEESLIYESLPTKAKLRALENPEFLRHLDPEQRAEVRDRLEVQRDLQQTIDSAQDLVSVTSSMGNILTRAGILDEGDARRANDAASLVANTAIAVAGCYAVEVVSCLSGVSGVVTGLSNLFGGDPGPSADDALLEGQRRLFQGQRRLLEGQRILMDGQTKLLEDQLATRQELRNAHRDVLENRIALLEATDAIDRRVTAGFDDVQRSLGAVLWEIGQLSNTVIDFSDFGTRLRECEDFVRRRVEYDFTRRIAYVPRTVEFALGEFAQWRALESHYATNGSYWSPCLRTLRDLFSRRQIYRDVHSVLRLGVYRGSTAGATLLTDYVNPGFAPLVWLMSRRYELQADADGMRTFCALLNSPLSYSGIDMRGATLFARESCGVPETESPLDGLWRRDGDATSLTVGEWLLHPDAVVELTHLMMELLPYYQITDQANQSLLSAATVANGASGKPADPDRVVEIEIVETAYRLVNIAIAQQVLMTGDIFLPLVDRYLFSSNVSANSRDAVIDVLAHNPVLARNWLVMEVGRQLSLGANSPTGPGENMELYRRIFEARGSSGNDADAELRYERLFPSYWIEETATRGSVAFSQTSNEVVVMGSRTASGAEAKSVRLAMPTPEHVATRHYSISREYVELTRLRAAIMDYVLQNDLELFGGAELVRNGYFVWH